MYRPRIIPVLLLDQNSLVKTIKFKDPIYLGDPINAVRMFNEMGADEIVCLDISASRRKRSIDPGFIKQIAEEAYMPFSVGGGISNAEQVEALITNGAEKVVINTALAYNNGFVQDIVRRYGSQSVIASVDVKKDITGTYRPYSQNGKRLVSKRLDDYLRLVEDLGVGEVFIQYINLDGTRKGYDVKAVIEVSRILSIPITVCGGAGSVNDMIGLYKETRIQGLAAASLFLFKNSRNSFLINYLSNEEKIKFRT